MSTGTAINVINDAPDIEDDSQDSGYPANESDTEDERVTPVPPHNDIYIRKPEYNHIMEKYDRQKAKEKSRNAMLEQEHKILHQHRHHRPDMTQREFYRDNQPEIGSSVPLKPGDNYIMQKHNEKISKQKHAREKKKQLGEHPSPRHNQTEDRMVSQQLREKYLQEGDQHWDRKYHAKKGDTYLQNKHNDFDKYWKKEENDWNKRFHDAGNWKWKSKSHHHKGSRETNYGPGPDGRDPYDILPQTLYPHYDKYWSHKWYDHFHNFERSKSITIAYHHRYHNEMLDLDDYYHPEIRNMGPQWWLKHLKRQLETEPRSINMIGNVAELIIKNFPVVVFTARYEKDHENVLKLVKKYRTKAEVSEDAMISIELDNSRAGLKIFSDLRHYSSIMELPQVWFNKQLLGSYETIKKLKKARRLTALLREAEFEGKMPCEKCQSAAKSWYFKWHRQHYPYFDKNMPYKGWA